MTSDAVTQKVRVIIKIQIITYKNYLVILFPIQNLIIHQLKLLKELLTP